MKQELHTYDQTWIQGFQHRLAAAEISENNRKLIESFQNYLFSMGSGNARVAKLSNQLIKVATFEENGKRVFPADFDTAKRNDILNLVSFLNRMESLSDATKSDYRRAIKQFYRWYKEEDTKLYSEDASVRMQAQRRYQYIEKDVKREYKVKQIDPAEVLQDEEIHHVVTKGCKTIKEKAVLKFLHEVGVRPGELINFRVKDIDIRKKWGVAYVDGKTGRRPVQFIRSKPYVVQWLETQVILQEVLNIFQEEQPSVHHQNLQVC